MKTMYSFVFLLLSVLTFGQVTLRITSIPTNTPANATIYAAGDFNAWNAQSAAHIMQPDGLGARTIVIPEATGTVGFKFTRGGWPTVEGNASGGFLPDRHFTFTGSPQTINLTILSWEDISGSGSSSTAAANVQILSNNFAIPQLNGRTRKIWLYLPPDYNTSTKTYPVLYMEDGQNLFDNATSFAGEWQIDETLNTLFSQGDYGAIVVGIDNGGGERLNEYSPWYNASYSAGGDGDDYMQFVAETLKPYIDSNFRTKPQPQFNALIGSSMGALISAYGACAYPTQFEKVGVFSPAFWFSLNDLNSYIQNTTNNLSNLRMYFVCGQNESASMVTDMNAVKNNLISNGVLAANTTSLIDPAGTHSESFWRSKFGVAYQWLFAETNLSTPNVAKPDFEIKQNAAGDIVVSGLSEAADFDILSVGGNKIQTIQLSNGIYQLPVLASGVYFLNSKETTVKIFIK
jgi:predicted alpha/beta superfamily hydrolase